MKNLQINNPKLRVVTHRELHPGQQAVQLGHAGITFQHEHPEKALPWHDFSNHLVFLSTDSEQSLLAILEKCRLKGLTHTVFVEPDLDNMVTAIAIEPHEDAAKITSNCRLALRDVKEVAPC